MQRDAIFDDFINILDVEQKNIMQDNLDILLSNIKLDYQSDINIKNDVLVVGDNPAALEFCNIAKNKFEILQKPYINSFTGSLGNFDVNFENQILHTSQIIFFTKYPSFDGILKSMQLGVHFADKYDGIDSMINNLDELIGDFTYENTILYDKNRCQYHHRNKNEKIYCSACESVCPTFAITKDDNLRELKFSNIDCIFCGKCVGVCPSGAMQKANAPLLGISKSANLYKNKISLIISFNDLEDNLDISKIVKNTKIIPFVLPNINILNEVYLLTILQSSGSKCIIYGDIQSKLSQSINYINDLYSKIFDTKAIYYFENEIDIDFIKEINQDQEALQLLEYQYLAEENEFSREIFSSRINFFIKDNDFGILENTPDIIYSNLEIDKDKCTLCMSCVEVCNTKALIHSKDNFELLLNPSLCTTCGICADICPEQIIKIPLNGIELKNTFFKYNTKAKDEPFECVECGKVFASAKSIQKVKAMMLPIFGNDKIKSHSLSCCSDCKVKIMFKVNNNSGI